MLPYLLAVAGGYLIGNAMKDKTFSNGGSVESFKILDYETGKYPNESIDYNYEFKNEDIVLRLSYITNENIYADLEENYTLIYDVETESNEDVYGRTFDSYYPVLTEIKKDDGNMIDVKLFEKNKNLNKLLDDYLNSLLFKYDKYIKEYYS